MNLFPLFFILLLCSKAYIIFNHETLVVVAFLSFIYLTGPALFASMKESFWERASRMKKDIATFVENEGSESRADLLAGVKDEQTPELIFLAMEFCGDSSSKMKGFTQISGKKALCRNQQIRLRQIKESQARFEQLLAKNLSL